MNPLYLQVTTSKRFTFPFPHELVGVGLVVAIDTKSRKPEGGGNRKRDFASGPSRPSRSTCMYVAFVGDSTADSLILAPLSGSGDIQFFRNRFCSLVSRSIQRNQPRVQGPKKVDGTDTPTVPPRHGEKSAAARRSSQSKPCPKFNFYNQNPVLHP